MTASSRQAATVLVALALLVAGPAATRARGRLVGVVTDLAGQPLEGVRVSLRAEGSEAAAAEATTDARGHFQVSLAEGGTFAVRFEGPGLAPLEGTVEVPAGQEVSLDVQLADEGVEAERRAAAAYNAGAEALRQREFETARVRFEEAAELDPDLAEPHLALASVHYETGDLERAALSIEIYLARRPEHDEAWRVAYEIQRARGDEERQVEALARLRGTETGRDLATRIYNEGAAATRAGEQETAKGHFRLALLADPGLAAAHAGLATAHYNLGEFDSALLAVEESLRLEEDQPQGRRLRYLVLLALGDTAAGEAFDAYLEADPEGALQILLDRGREAFEGDRHDEAREALDRVLKIDSQSAAAHHLLGLVHLSAGDPQRARQHLERFLELAPDDPEAATVRAILEQL